MVLDLPVCKRCCFCIPLRAGLIIWGYFSLLVGCFLLTASFLISIKRSNVPESEELEMKTDFIVITCVTVITGIAEIILSLIFIVGCHTKNVKLMKMFYYYSMLFLTVTSILTLYSCFTTLLHTIQAYKSGTNADFFVYFLLVDISILFANFFFQLYILLAVRSEIIKLNNGCQFRFSNIGTETQCTMTIEDPSKDEEVPNQDMHPKTVIKNCEEIKTCNSVS